MKSLIITIFLIASMQQNPVAQISPSLCSTWLQECESEIDDFISLIEQNYHCGSKWLSINLNVGFSPLEEPLKRAGDMAIGTANPKEGYKLTVTEGVIAKNLKLCEGSSWCDYVFEDEYNLLSLKEVEDHIQKTGHLHNTPSGEEIEKQGGFDLSDVALDHQEKIEEIFLHLIELKKEADQLQSKLAELKKENVELKKEKED